MQAADALAPAPGNLEVLFHKGGAAFVQEDTGSATMDPASSSDEYDYLLETDGDYCGHHLTDRDDLDHRRAPGYDDPASVA